MFVSYRSKFEEYDLDKNGVLDYSEVEQCLRNLNVQMVNVDLPVLYLLCDVDGTGLDYDGFQTFVSKVMIHGAMSQ